MFVLRRIREEHAEFLVKRLLKYCGANPLRDLKTIVPESIDPFTERKASWVIGAYFDCSNACFKKLFHASHLGVPSNSGSYSLKISSKFMETTQHLPETQDFEILITFSAWTLLNLCASFTNCALLRVSYSITSLYR